VAQWAPTCLPLMRSASRWSPQGCCSLGSSQIPLAWLAGSELRRTSGDLHLPQQMPCFPAAELPLPTLPAARAPAGCPDPRAARFVTRCVEQVAKAVLLVCATSEGPAGSNGLPSQCVVKQERCQCAESECPKGTIRRKHSQWVHWGVKVFGQSVGSNLCAYGPASSHATPEHCRHSQQTRIHGCRLWEGENCRPSPRSTPAGKRRSRGDASSAMGRGEAASARHRPGPLSPVRRTP
jgi:hypothetical protein